MSALYGEYDLLNEYDNSEDVYSAYCIVYDDNGREMYRTPIYTNTSTGDTREQQYAIQDAIAWINAHNVRYDWELVASGQKWEPDDALDVFAWDEDIIGLDV